MRLALLVLLPILAPCLVVPLVVVAFEPPKPLTIPLKAPDLLVCAEYISQGAPRDVQRSCIDASRVRDWILQNGRPTDECSR